MRRALALLLILFAGSAFADELTRYTTPAERARSCVFADRFESQALVESNAGTVTGAPTFSPVTGMTLDGSSDDVAYSLTGQEFNSATLSIAISFTPHFDHDANATPYIMDTTPSSPEYLIYKQDNAGSNVLEIWLGGTRIEAIAEGTYSPYWAPNERHTLVVSADADNDLTDAWLCNETAGCGQILTADATAWAVTSVTTLHVGQYSGGGAYRFDGGFHSFQIYHALLTAGEAQDFYDHTTYTYANQATAHYQMRLVDHDATNTTTIDSTGKAGDLTLVHAPVKQTAHGYDFDGTNDYLTGTIAASTFNSAEILIVLEMAPDFDYDYDAEVYLMDTPGSYEYAVIKRENANTNTLRIILGDAVIADIASATYSPYWRQYQRNVLVISSSATTDLTDVWLNGSLILDGDATAWAEKAPVALTIGRHSTGFGANFDGKIYSVIVAPINATFLQALDIDHNIRLRGNDQ